MGAVTRYSIPMSDIAPLLHIARAADLERARRDERALYRCDSLDGEGFVHCCEQEQLPGVVARHYAGVDDLVLLVIERGELGAELVHESAPGGGERFPHVYGPIELAAVRETRAFGLDDPARVGLPPVADA